MTDVHIPGALRPFVLLAALMASGCSLLATDAGQAIVAKATDALANAVEQQVGKSLGDVPVTCDVETDPKAHRVLMLCTACTDGATPCR